MAGVAGNRPKTAILPGKTGPPLYETGTRHVRDRYETRTSLGQGRRSCMRKAYWLWHFGQPLREACQCSSGARPQFGQLPGEHANRCADLAFAPLPP
jgi:hypothetical protein